MLSNLVAITDSKAVTTSQIVAEAFEKQHAHVLRSIERVECSEGFRQSNFGLASYADSQGKPRPMYQITRDGFTFLAMGFTGKKAAEFKERFIAAFNAMEQALLEQHGIDRRVQVDHNHRRGITNPHGLDVAFRLDLTKIVLNPNRKSMQVLERLTGVDMSDLVDEWSLPHDHSPVPGIDTWLTLCQPAERTFMSAMYDAYLGWLGETGQIGEGRPLPSKRIFAAALRAQGVVVAKVGGSMFVYGKGAPSC